MSSINNYSLTYSFPMWLPFISSTCLTVTARTSSTVANKRGESEHPSLVPHLKGNNFCLCPLSMMLAVGLSHMASIRLRYVPAIYTLLRVFIRNGCWFYQML